MSHFPKLEGQKAINVLRVASAGKGGETVSIGPDVFELTTFDDLRVAAGHIPVDLHAGTTVKAQGTLTFTTQPADADTVTIDTKVYTFKTTLDNVDGHVLRGASAAESEANLIAAINLGAGAGTKYAISTTKHPTVKASDNAGAMVATALQGGTVGNSIASTKSSTHISWDAATLGTTTLGVDPAADDVSDALVSVINASGTQSIVAREISDNEVLIVSKIPQVMTLACTKTLSGSNNVWAAAAMYGGAVGKRRRLAVVKRVPNATEVAIGNLHFELGFTPTVAFVMIAPTSTPGAWKLWDGGITISGGHVTLDNGGSTDWAATDTVEAFFFE